MTTESGCESRLAPPHAGAGVGVGVARVDITPPVGAPLLGFKGRGPATGLRDPLTATALVLGGKGTQPVAWVCCDLEGIDAEWVDQAEQYARTLTGMEDLLLLVSCSHTHYGPAGPTMDGEGELSDGLARRYTELLVHDIAGVVQLAAADMTPSRVRAMVGASGVGVNRRETSANGEIVLGHNLDGPCDDRLLVLAIEKPSGELIASVVNFACHPVVLGDRCLAISADFVAPLRVIVEGQTGAPCLFVQGAAGDIDPRVMDVGDDGPLEVAAPLAGEVMRLLTSRPRAEAEPEDIRLTSCTRLASYPEISFASVDEGEHEVATLAAEYQSLSDNGQSGDGDLVWSRLRLQRAETALAAIKTGQTPSAMLTRHAAVMLSSDIALVTVPCELFNELGSAVIAGSPFPATVMAGYTNGVMGYVPTAAAYPEGGYEVTHGSRVARGSGEVMVETCLSLLHELPRPARHQLDTQPPTEGER